MQYSTSAKAIGRRVYQHVIQKVHTFFAVVQPGFEHVALQELSRMGLQHCVQAKGGVAFRGKLTDCYRANYFSRVVTRILMRLCHFRAYHFNEIYRNLKDFPWELYIPNGATIDVEVSVHKSKLHHTERIAQEVAGALQKRVSIFGMQCNVTDTLQKIFVRFDHDECMVSLDTTGDPLYKRGYKQYVHEAPLRETIAAALLLESHVHEYDTIIDPMCGSGTFPLEAWSILTSTPPGFKRRYSFMHWPSFRQQQFNEILKEDVRCTLQATIIGSDKDLSAVTIAQKNALEAGATIQFKSYDFLQHKLDIEGEKILCVLNPPYGKRIAAESAKTIFTRLSNILENWYHAWSFCLLVPYALRSECTIPVDKEIHFTNGGIPVIVLIAHRGR